MPTLLDDLVAYYPLDEASGNAIDSHTGSHDMTETSGTIAAGTGGRDFEAGDTEYFTVADHADFSVDSFTLAVEVELESKPASGMYIVSKWGAGGNRSYRLFWDNGPDRFVFVVSNDGGASVSITANNLGAPALATKYHIIVKHDTDKELISIQVNGGQPNTLSHTTGLFDNTGPFVLGALFTTSASSYFDGIIGKMGLWGRVLLPIEERALYNSGSPIGYASFGTNIPEPFITKSIGTDTHQAQSGTIDALSAGTTAITGTSTAFSTEFTTSNRLVLELDDGSFHSYEITAITNDTSLTIAGGLFEATDGDETPFKEGSARDYSTITAWEADLDNDTPYDDGDNAIGEMYDDSSFDESPIVNGGIAIGGSWGKLASFDLTVPEAERHDGTAGTGARLVFNAGISESGIEFRYSSVAMPYEFSWLEIDCNGQYQNETVKDQEATGTVTKIMRHLIMHGSLIDLDEVNHYGFQIKGGSSSTLQVFERIIIYDYETQTDTGWMSAFQLLENRQRLYNITIHNFRSTAGAADITGVTAWVPSTSSYVDTSTDEVKNVVCTDVSSFSATAKCFDVPNTTVSNNASSDATASGTGSLTSITAADQYVSVVEGSEDLHLKSGADCLDVATDLGTTPEGVNIDIDGRDVDAEGDTWDIGADEFVAVGGGTITPFMMQMAG